MPVMARILVTEAIADGGLDQLRDAGHVVDVRTDLTPEQLLAVVPGAHALIIRSATQVTAEVLAAGRTWWWSAAPGSVSTTSTSRRRPHVA